MNCVSLRMFPLPYRGSLCIPTSFIKSVKALELAVETQFQDFATIASSPRLLLHPIDLLRQAQSKLRRVSFYRTRREPSLSLASNSAPLASRETSNGWVKAERKRFSWFMSAGAQSFLVTARLSETMRLAPSTR